MIHLIDRVYIEYAEARPLPRNPLLSTEKYIRIIDRGLSVIIDKDFEDKNLFNVKRLEEAYEKFGSNTNFVNYLLSVSNTSETKKITIYADEIATVQIMIAFWKSMFPKITASGAFKIYKTYKDFEKLKPKDQVNFIAIDEGLESIDKSYFFEKYWGLSFDKFSLLFENTKELGLDPKQKEKVGLEYLMIKYILNKNESHSALKLKTQHFYKKMLMHEICGLREVCKEFLYNILVSENQLVDDVCLSEKAITDLIKTHPKYAVILDNEISYSIKSYQYIKEKYNLIKIVNDLVNAEFIALKIMGIEQEKKDIAFCTYILDNHKEPEVVDILDDQLLYANKFRIFRELAKKGRYNQYLVISFLKTFEKSKESLAEFME